MRRSWHFGVFRPVIRRQMVSGTRKSCRVALNEIPRTQNCRPIASAGDLPVFWSVPRPMLMVKHDVNPSQNRRRLIRHLRTTLRDDRIEGMRVSANCARVSTGFWLRENACHSDVFAAPFRLAFGRRIHSGSVGKLQIGFGTAIIMGGAREAQTQRILSKRHTKQGIDKRRGHVCS
jgi:hypothetical protein